MASLEMRIWGLIGAGFAGAFAIWLLFFPDKANDFAWVIEPRLAQVFIGGGYIFRTAFFLNVAIWPRWERFRWILWGNLAFTGTLVGWAVWCGTMAFASDWRDVRAAAYLNMIAGAGILAASLASLPLFNSPRTGGYLVTLATLTVLMAFFTWRQERSTA